VDNLKNITNSQNSVRKKSFGGTFSFSNCHIKIGVDNGSVDCLCNYLRNISFLTNNDIKHYLGEFVVL
jgi:hypothetical protein